MIKSDRISNIFFCSLSFVIYIYICMHNQECDIHYDKADYSKKYKKSTSDMHPFYIAIINYADLWRLARSCLNLTIL